MRRERESRRKREGMDWFLIETTIIRVSVAFWIMCCDGVSVSLGTGRLWRTYYMDSSDMSVTDDNDCDVVRPVRNDDMSEGDFYRVNSDNGNGRQDQVRRSAECTMAFNLGDRMVAVEINEWWCLKQTYTEPFLAIYDDCEGKRNGLLALLNCTSSLPTSYIHSSTYCITLYHYRGHVRSGYYFSVSIVAMKELFAFPAGGIAAIIICAIVAIMVIAKIGCVISGYERRMPEVIFEDDDQKQMLTSYVTDKDVDLAMENNRHCFVPVLPTENNVRTACHEDLLVGSCNSTNSLGRLNRPPDRNHAHSILKYNRSPRSSYGMHCISEAEASSCGGNHTGLPANRRSDAFSDTDYDFLDISIDDSPPSPEFFESHQLNSNCVL